MLFCFGSAYARLGLKFHMCASLLVRGMDAAPTWDAWVCPCHLTSMHIHASVSELVACHVQS